MIHPMHSVSPSSRGGDGPPDQQLMSFTGSFSDSAALGTGSSAFYTAVTCPRAIVWWRAMGSGSSCATVHVRRWWWFASAGTAGAFLGFAQKHPALCFLLLNNNFIQSWEIPPAVPAREAPHRNAPAPAPAQQHPATRNTQLAPCARQPVAGCVLQVARNRRSGVAHRRCRLARTVRPRAGCPCARQHLLARVGADRPEAPRGPENQIAGFRQKSPPFFRIQRVAVRRSGNGYVVMVNRLQNGPLMKLFLTLPITIPIDPTNETLLSVRNKMGIFC
jgi:hypothetical protein